MLLSTLAGTMLYVALLVWWRYRSCSVVVDVAAVLLAVAAVARDAEVVVQRIMAPQTRDFE